MCGNCFANTRNLINDHFLQGREPEAQEQQAEGTGRDRGDERVPGEARGHFRHTQQVLHTCWEQAETWKGGQGEQSLRAEATAQPPGGCPSPQGPADPPAASTGARTRVHCPGPGTAWQEGRGCPCLLCLGQRMGVLGHHLVSESLSGSVFPSLS